jgi:hypothetical protein
MMMRSASRNNRGKKISQAEYGDHDIILYDNLADFREIYSYYCKEAFEPNNDIVLIATTYESIHRVKSNLESEGIDVPRRIGEGSLWVIDSVKGYHMPDVYGLLKLARSLEARAEKEEKSGVAVFADMGSFFLLNKRKELVDYEQSVPGRLNTKLKAFCCYHSDDFNTLAKPQKKMLLESHHVAV